MKMAERIAGYEQYDTGNWQLIMTVVLLAH